MLTTRWHPFVQARDEMNRLRDEMDRLFSRRGLSASAYPALNLWEDNDRLFVEAELPGMELADLEIYVTGGNQLSIQGERKEPVVENAVRRRRERSYGKFSRVIELPSDVDADQVTAEFKHGVLTVTLPKREEAKPRRIEVSVN